MRPYPPSSNRIPGTALAASALCLMVAIRAASGGPEREPAERFSVTEAREMVLARVEGDTPIDVELRKWQQRAASAPATEAPWTKLGELFVAKARLTADPAFYKFAELSSRVLESVSADPGEALLLRGHAWLAMHRFRDAENVARRLVQLREQMSDHALLGDALVDQGRIAEAANAYQVMIDLKPCLPSYSRISHLRWITGDLDGAKEALRMAIACGNYRDPEPLAWTTTRLALLELQDNKLDTATRLTQRALELVPDYSPALVVEARVALAEMRTADAVPKLRRAAALNPLPETKWLLADALRIAGRESESAVVELELEREGALHDGRTSALFLATRGRQTTKALQLAEAELRVRQDVFSFDALAWAQYATGDIASARRYSQRALEAGTNDARLFLHSGLIASAAGEADEAARLLAKANDIKGTLFPSERQALASAAGIAAPNHKQP